MLDDFLMEPEEQARNELEKRQREEYLVQLKKVLETKAGYALILKILRDCGVERLVPYDATSRTFALREFGDTLLNDIQEVSMNTCLNLICNLREDKNARR